MGRRRERSISTDGADGSNRRQRRPRDDDTSDDDAPRRKDWYKEVQRSQRLSGKVLDAPDTTSAPPPQPKPTVASTTVAAPADVKTPKVDASSQSIFSGLLAAPVTPMLPNGAVDLDMIAVYGRELKADGVSGVFCCGTTGESMSLSVRERKAATERWVATGLKVCTHIGAHSVQDTIELAEHAQSCGAHAAAVLCPGFFKPPTVEEVVDFLSEVARAAPRLPILYYHFPALNGVDFKLFDILRAAQNRGTVPTLRGAKFTSLDLGDFAACQSLKGVTDLLSACEQNLMGAAFLGGTAFVGAQFSVIAPLYLRLMAAAQKGDAATTKKFQQLAVSFINMIQGIVGPSLPRNIAALKTLV